MNTLSIYLCVFLAARGAFSLCVPPPGAGDNGGRIMFQLEPKVADILATAPQGAAPGEVVRALKSTAEAAQGVIDKLVELSGLEISCTHYWGTNQLFCKNVNKALILAACTAVGIISDVQIPQAIPIGGSTFGIRAGPELACNSDANGMTWGQNKIKARDAWNLGCNGTGVRVANIDTGARGTHDELRDNKCPTFNWHDPWNISVTDPTDDNGHGTHTLATIAGKTVGVAPGACWMSCRGCNNTACDWEKMVACGQFMSCPDGEDTNCAMKPDIVSCSWGGAYPQSSQFDGILTLWKNMGIASFFAGGNSGPTCNTLQYPAGENPNKGHMSVGATQCDDTTAKFSSAGPSNSPNNFNGLGPRIIAPGSSIRSAWSTGDSDYKWLDGTSQATPHVAGAAAVLLCKKKMPPTQLYNALTSSANQAKVVTLSATCNSTGFTMPFFGSKETATYPNNMYGYGFLNLLAAYNKA